MDYDEIFLESVDSTNNWAKNNARNFNPQKITCITADEQTHGKGRRERCWISPKGQNIYTTFYFRLPRKTLHLTSIGLILAYSLATVLIKEGLSPKIKWPNDILLHGKKVAGILCETIFEADYIDIFLGIGINVNMDEKILSQIDQPATSLKKETGTLWDREELLKKLQKHFYEDLEKFKKEGFTPCHCQFENLLAYKGELVTCYNGKEEFTGIVHSLTCDGELNLFLPAKKEMKTFLSGDIHFKKY